MEIIIIPVALFILMGFRVVYEYKRAVKFRLGNYVKVLGPGLRWIIPFIERIQIVDVRVITQDIPIQEVMTKDNVPVRINGVLYYRIHDPKLAVLEVERYMFAISQLAQASLRDVCGKVDLDTILSKREEIGENIKAIVDKETDPWGITITDVKIKDIELPDNMKRSMAHQAEAERQRRARVILANAEREAADQLFAAGSIIDQSPSALKLRLFQTLTDISAEKNSTILFPFPAEMLDFIAKDKKS